MEGITSARFKLSPIITSYFICLIFGTIGYSIGMIFRKIHVAIGAFLILHLTLPVLSKYDYKNSTQNIFYSAYSKDLENNIKVINMSIAEAIISILVFLVILAGIGWIRFSKSSKYS